MEIEDLCFPCTEKRRNPGCSLADEYLHFKAVFSDAQGVMLTIIGVHLYIAPYLYVPPPESPELHFVGNWRRVHEQSFNEGPKHLELFA